jgi:hypothetical protein
MTANEIIALVDTYVKHEWMLREIVLRPVSAENVGASLRSTYGDVVRQGQVDCAWFSRRPDAGAVPWELRYLGQPPFARFDRLDETEPSHEEKKREHESRLAERLSKR